MAHGALNLGLSYYKPSEYDFHRSPSPDIRPNELLWLEMEATPPPDKASAVAAVAVEDKKRATKSNLRRVAPTVDPTTVGNKDDNTENEPSSGVIVSNQDSSEDISTSTKPASKLDPRFFDPRNAAIASMDWGSKPVFKGSTVQGKSRASDTSSSAQDTNQRLQALLKKDAKQSAYLKKRAPPKLRRLADGSYRYIGPVISASIGIDGEVRFDKSSSGKTKFNRRGFDFDLNSAVMRSHGADPDSAEKMWFMAQTRGLRERLRKKQRSQSDEDTSRALRRDLQRLWYSRMPIEQKKRKIFNYWDDCSESPLGIKLRRIIEGFVRRHLPSDSANAYTQSELRKINQRRQSKDSFAPYGNN